MELQSWRSYQFPSLLVTEVTATWMWMVPCLPSKIQILLAPSDFKMLRQWPQCSTFNLSNTVSGHHYSVLHYLPKSYNPKYSIWTDSDRLLRKSISCLTSVLHCQSLEVPPWTCHFSWKHYFLQRNLVFGSQVRFNTSQTFIRTKL